MTIYLKKFGTTLSSRQSGKEALAAFMPTLKTITPEEAVTVDFDGVLTFTPSWGDEFLTPLAEQLHERLFLKKTENLSVQATLEILEKVSGMRFAIKSESR